MQFLQLLEANAVYGIADKNSSLLWVCRITEMACLSCLIMALHTSVRQ